MRIGGLTLGGGNTPATLALDSIPGSDAVMSDTIGIFYTFVDFTGDNNKVSDFWYSLGDTSSWVSVPLSSLGDNDYHEPGSYSFKWATRDQLENKKSDAMFVKFRLKDMGTTYSNYVTSDTLQFNNGYTLSFTATTLSDTSIRLTWYPGEITTADAESVGIWYRNDAFPDSATDPAAVYVGSYALADSADTLEGLDFASMYYYFLAVKDSAGGWSGFPDIGRDSAMTLDTNETMLFVDDFEHQAIGTDPSGWSITESAGEVSIADSNGNSTGWGGRHAMLDQPAATELRMEYSVTPVYDGIIIIEWDQNLGSDGNAYMIFEVVSADDDEIIRLVFDTDHIINNINWLGNNRPICSYFDGNSHYKVIIDLQEPYFEFYQNGVAQTPPAFRYPYESVAGVRFRTVSYAAKSYADNVSMYRIDDFYDPDSLQKSFDVIAVSCSSAAMSWEPDIFGNDIDSVGIWYKTGGYPDSVGDVNSTALTYDTLAGCDTLTGLSPCSTYYFIFAAKDTAGNWTDYGGVSKDSTTCLDTNEYLFYCETFEDQAVGETPDGWSINAGEGFMKVIDWEQNPSWGRKCLKMSETWSEIYIYQSLGSSMDTGSAIIEWDYRREETNARSCVFLYDAGNALTIRLWFEYNGSLYNYKPNGSRELVCSYDTDATHYKIVYNFQDTVNYDLYVDGTKYTLLKQAAASTIRKVSFYLKQKYADCLVDNVRLYECEAGGSGRPKRPYRKPVVRTYRLALNASPNPFSSATSIRYAVEGEHPAATSVRIYGGNGRLLTELYNGYRFPGSYDVIWDGRGDDGRKVDDGIYFYEVTTDGTRQIGVLMRMEE